jgi:predicted MFS family arabinose efflux permease
MQESSIKKDIYISWLILVMFFLYQYILRSSPGVLIEEIRHHFSMNAKDFALMGAMYYYGYSIMQIPLGILIDKFGLRYTVFVSIIFCIAGTYLLTATNNSMVAYFSRLLVGIGSASAFMSSVKLARDYLPFSKQGIALGATLTFGSIGALMGGKPLNQLIEKFNDWQTAFIIFAVSGILILFFAFLYIPTKEEYHSSDSINDQVNKIWQNLTKIITNKKILTYSVIAIGLFAPLSVMADLWGTAFLMKKFSLTRESASPILMNIYIGMAIGSIILPLFIKKFHINNIIKFSTISLLLVFAILVYMPNLSKTNLTSLLIAIGFFCGAEMLCFTAALRYADSSISGLTIGVVNTLNMLSGALMQQVIGKYLDFSWNGALNDVGLRIYSTQKFIEAFSILVAIIGICVIISLTLLRDNKENI